MSPTVQLLITCLLDSLYPDTAESVVRVLERAGAQVECPSGQTCCGQPAFNAGMRAQARPMAIQMIRTFENTTGDVVVPSGSCAGMIKHGYPELFADDAQWLPRARALAARTYEFTQYLVDVLGITDLSAHFPATVTYHSSCHLLREMNIRRQPRLLLEAVKEARFVELPNSEECCGFGGVFSAEHAQISSEILKRKIEAITASGAPWIVACDAGCITNINGGLHRMGKSPRAIHIADVLDKT